MVLRLGSAHYNSLIVSVCGGGSSSSSNDSFIIIIIISSSSSSSSSSNNSESNICLVMECIPSQIKITFSNLLNCPKSCIPLTKEISKWYRIMLKTT